MTWHRSARFSAWSSCLPQKNAYAFPVVAIPVVFPLLYYVTHTSLRYRHPIDPIVLLLTAIGVHGVWSWLTRKRHKTTPAETSVA
jgi:hypothetical protein